MGDDVRHSGEIRIDPPIDYDQLEQRSGFLQARFYDPEFAPRKDVVLAVEEQSIPGGFTRRATAIRPLALGTYSGYHVLEHVQELVDTYGDGRTFTGWIECVHPEGEQWRIGVRDGRAVQVSARLVWPGEEEDAETWRGDREVIVAAIEGWTDGTVPPHDALVAIRDTIHGRPVPQEEGRTS